MTAYFQNASLHRSDIILTFQCPESREITGFFSISGLLWFQLIFHHMREEGKECQDHVCFREIIRENKVFEVIKYYCLLFTPPFLFLN